MKTLQFLLLALCIPWHLHAQGSSLRGAITDTAGKPLRGIAVSLLYPTDSTMAAFGVTDGDGVYLIQAVPGGTYLLQAAGMDLRTHYQPIAMPVAGGMLPRIIMKAIDAVALEGVQVSGEKIPILLKRDTIEYNGSSFKTRPGAVTEELLRKLPGVEVDKAGNIKAGGKDVQRVMVDGKEFFSNDPKVATKNLPADAIDKVQVFDALSQSAQYTGIDDGEREKTINLKLKEKARHGYFGDMEGGSGTDGRFKLAGHYYRFKKRSQFAALGMANNINQFGFSLQDYFSFSGGLGALLEGGGGESGGNIQLGGNLPVNFGQPVTGLITSGALGLNYTFEPKGGRYNVSYMGNGADKRLEQQTTTQNFTSTETFARDEELDEYKQDFSHGLNFNVRQNLDSTQQLRGSGSAGFANSNARRNLMAASTIRAALLNQLDSRILNDGDELRANGNLSYTLRRGGAWPVIRFSAGATAEKSLAASDWANKTFYAQSGASFTDNQYQHNKKQQWSYNVSAGLTRKLDAHNFLEGGLRGAEGSDALERRQGLAGDEEHSIDSLSPAYSRRYDYVRPGLSFRHSTQGLQYSIVVNGEWGWLQARPQGGAPAITTGRSYLLPGAYLQYTIDTRSSMNASYNSSVSPPSALQMLPATDYTNPVQRIRGNPALIPEVAHNGSLSYHRFDAFSFTSLMASLNGKYTHDKIVLSRSINPDLSEDLTYINVPDDYNVSGRADYSTPVRKLGINLSLRLSEQYNKGMTVVNGMQNSNNTFTHGAKLGIGNRKKDVWDADVSLGVAYTDSKYSVMEAFNTSYVQYTATASLSYQPTDFFYCSVSADVDRYQSAAFANPLTVPLVQASASYYFLKAKRGALTLDAFDLLDRNRSIVRSSQLNYLYEQRSNTIGRYFLLSFKYRLTMGGGGKRE